MSDTRTPRRQPHVMVVTGMSGAGRSQTAKVLEDVGYFVVDNLPPQMIGGVVDYIDLVDRPRSRLAVVVDTRHGVDFTDLETAVEGLQRAGITVTVLFLDASTATLVQRYEEQRRPHPVAADTLIESIDRERAALEHLRGEADVIIDTTDRNVHELRQLLEEAFTDDPGRRTMRIGITSFGFKRGVPRVLDLLFDVRFLPNPHWVTELRPHTGENPAVRDFVLSSSDAAEFLERANDLLDFLVPRYVAEGKAYLTIGVGCTGGNHRSVVIADELARHLTSQGIDVAVHHRDAGKGDR